MARLAEADADRTVNDAARWTRSSRARTMVQSVDAAISSTSHHVEDDRTAVEGYGVRECQREVPVS